MRPCCSWEPWPVEEGLHLGQCYRIFIWMKQENQELRGKDGDESGRSVGTKGGAGVGSRRNGRGKQGGGAGAHGEDSTTPMLYSEALVPFTLMPI